MLIIVEITREHHCYITSFEMEKQCARKTAINHPYEGKHAETPDSSKVFPSCAQPITVNINNSTGITVGNSNVVDHTFQNLEHAAAGENVQPRMLEDELRRQARIYSEKILPPPIQLERAIVPVSLQIAREPVRVPDVLHAEGHLHRRKDIVKFFERPPGDITEEEMFDLPKQQAQKEADWTCKTDDDKMAYIKTHGNILAVIGWPGIGKTTSMRRWIGQIVIGKLIPNVKHVFFIFVRDIDFSKKMTVFQFLLSTIIPDWEHSTESDKAWLKKLFSDQNVLIALEGIDESAVKDLTIRAPKLNLYDTANPLHIMLNLIGGKLLPLARIVISSRPDHLFHLHSEHRPECIVQILGLNKDAQDELGHQIWGARYERVKVILEKNPHTFAYCFVPVNFILTADYLMSESEVDFVCMTRVLASACKKYSVSDHLHGKECDLDKLSKLAWNGYKKMQIVFEEDELKEVTIDENTMRSFLNTSVVESANIKMTIMEGDKRSSFSHLIWQEFFVAVFLLYYSTDDFDQLLQHIHETRWEVISKFLFGLCNNGVFDNMRCFKGSCSKVQWLDKRDQLKNVAITRMKSLNQRLPAHQGVKSPQNQSQSVAASQCEASSEYEPPVMSPHLQSTAYSCQQMTTNQKLRLPSNQYKPVAPNQHQSTPANQMHLFHPPYQFVTNSYEQRAANQHVPVWARSSQQMVPQLNQSLMTSQSHQLSSNPFMSNQSLCYSSYPSYQPMWNQSHQSAESQHPLEAYNWQQPMTHQYEQLGRNQYRSTFESSPHQMNLQLHQNLMSNQSLCYSSYPSYQPMWNQYHQSAESQHLSEAYNWQQPMRHQYEQLVTNQYRPAFESSSQHMNQQLHQNLMSNQSLCYSSYPSYQPMWNQYHQSAESQHLSEAYNWQQPMRHQYEQLLTNQYRPAFESSSQHMNQQLHQNLMSNQSHQFPSDQFVSRHHPSHPGPRHIVNHFDRPERTQHLLPNIKQTYQPTSPDHQQPTTKYPRLAGSSYQHPGVNHYEQLTANPCSEPFADQQQLSLASQCQPRATNTNQQFPANFHKVSPGSPLSHPASTHYQQVAASSGQEFGSNQPYVVKAHHPIASQAPLSATHQFQQSSSTEFQPNSLHHDPLTHHHQQLAAKPLHDDDDDLQQPTTWPDEDSSKLSEEDLSDEWKTLLQICSWIHEANDENITRDVVAHLPDHIVFPRDTTILPSDVSDLFYALQSSLQSHTLKVDNCNFTGDSLKIFSKEVSSNIKIQSFDLDQKKLNEKDFSAVVEISQHVEEKLRLVNCEITSCQVSSLAEKLRETRSKIQHLNLSKNEFSDEDFSNLALCLKNIQKLELSRCDISSAGCAKFAKKLMKTGNAIQHLNLSYNKFSDEEFSNLALCLKNIQKLELSYCDISSAGCAKFAENLMATGNTIQHLNLSYNKFSDEEFSNLALCLKNIQKLELRSCHISSAGCAKFAKKLMATGNTIQHLNLSHNKFSDEEFSNLTLCLKNIQKLELIGCDISSAGCAKFAENLMATGNTLEFLNLGHNQLMDDGARSLIPCLNLIEKLSLWGCNVTEAVREEIRSELKRLGLPESRVMLF